MGEVGRVIPIGWHHRVGDRVRLVYANHAVPWRGKVGVVVTRFGKGGGPRNFAVDVDGVVVVVPGGNMRAMD